MLELINGPKDLKSLNVPQMQQLAKEIRELLVETISHTGGHLAPNLGVVELSIALHKVFNSPRDKIIWDVGHQAYVHKILTGRKNRFHTLRQMGGLSGFPKRSESVHDVFGTGHSSTSISAALGTALARDRKGDNYHVLAVIGDGSLTGGMAYEALNNAGDLGSSMTVILNDNEMSIAKNVGAMSEYLSRVRTAPTYARAKRDIEFLLKRIPAIGESVAKTVEHLKDTLKTVLVPGALFQELGFNYIGPIDGHNIPLLIEVLESSKNMEGPLLIHVITTKGKGYAPAECKADKFHGVGPFCAESGEILKNTDKPTYTKIFGDTLIELAEQNENIVAITAAMPDGTGLVPFAKTFPERFFDVGIAEQHAVTMGAAMAAQGMKPFVAIYSTFMQRAYDQVLHDICLQKLPVVLAMDRAGIVGDDGATHQGIFDFSYLRNIPNLVIMAPKDENELRQMLYTASQAYYPVAIRYPRGTGYGVERQPEFSNVEVGKAEVLKEGKQVVFVGVGAMVDSCLKAAEILAHKGIDAGVVNARFVKPLDRELLARLAREVGIIVTVEDNVLAGGFGSAVLEHLNDQGFYNVQVLRLGYSDQFIEHGKREEILEKYQLDAKGIALQAEKFLRRFGVKKIWEKNA